MSLSNRTYVTHHLIYDKTNQKRKRNSARERQKEIIRRAGLELAERYCTTYYDRPTLVLGDRPDDLSFRLWPQVDD